MRLPLLLLMLAIACDPSAPGGSGDPGITTPTDADGDGYAVSEDCDDSRADVHPGAPETCDGLDNDCDDAVDPDSSVDATTWFSDADSDTYGDTTTSIVACVAPDGFVSDDTDCDDTRPRVNPGASETCNGIDDDCDSVVDPDSSMDAAAWFADADADSFGDPAESLVACEAPAGFVGDGTDCDDTRPTVHPGAAETCNGVDDDCDGSIDPNTSVDAPTWFADADADSYGDPAVYAVACGASEGFVAAGTDCDDTRPAVHPGAAETCNGLDDDCDGATDPDSAIDALTWYADVDEDTYGDPAATTLACVVPVGFVSDNTDCDDTRGGVNPAATETCDGLDDDCDGTIDPDSSIDASTWYADADADTYGDPAVLTIACDAPASFVGDDTDCDDATAAVNPAALETCDGVDQDCNGAIDDNPTDGTEVWLDGDGDGYGDAATATRLCTLITGYATLAGDCDDADGAVSPGADELCWNGTDDDCDGYDADDADCAPVGTGWDEALTVTGTTSVRLTRSVAGLGDVFGTGHATLAVGGGYTNGAVWLFDNPLASTSLTDTDAWVVVADATVYTGFGKALTNAGDFDGDGLDDLAVAAPDTSAGTVYLYAATSLATASVPGDAGVVLAGMTASDSTGGTICAAGDVNADGIGDLLVGAAGNDIRGSAAGAVWFVPGGTASRTLSPTADGVIVGDAAGDGLGACAGLGDVDGDGYADVAVGAAGSDEAATDAGRVYVFRGPLDDRRYQAGAAWLRIAGSAASQGVGSAVRSGGDVDADGVPDLLVQAAAYDDGASTNVGAVGLFYGPLPRGVLDLSAANVLIVGDAANDGSGAALAESVDVDADGWTDILFGAPGSDLVAASAGGAFVFYGPVADGTYANADADAILTESAGDAVGTAITSVGDLDGDGDAEFAAGASAGSYGETRVWTGGSRLEPVASAPDAATDDDGDGFSEDGGDCDDGRAARAPDLTETCGAGSDEDCDGFADRCAPSASVSITGATSLVASTVTGTYGQFGDPVRCMGDINGDGADDLVVSDAWYSSSTGRTWIFFGPTSRGALTTANADVVLSALGQGTRVGDLNGDGIDDLNVGNSFFYGGPALYGTLTSADADITYDFGGWYSGVGDVDGDGYADFHALSGITSAHARLLGGTSTVWFGPIDASSTSSIDHVSWSGDAADASVGGDGAINVGDLDGDGIGDLVIPGARVSIDQGTGGYFGVWGVAYGPLPASGDLEFAALDAFLPVLYYGFENAAAGGDFDGDGTEDLAVGSATGLYPDVAFVSMAGRYGVVEVEDEAYATIHTDAYDFYELALDSGDVDRDGFDDLVLGGYEFSGAGGVWVFRGPLSGEYDLIDADYVISGLTDELLGMSVAVGDFDGDGFDDFASGARDYGADAYEVGAFVVEYGGASATTTGALVVPDSADDADGDGWAPDAGDCHDGDAAVSPGATEACGDSLDDDCDGFALACAPSGTWPTDGRQVIVAGWTVAAPGDLNGDGLGDFFTVDLNDDAAYVLYAPFGPESLDVTDGYDATFGISTYTLEGALAAFGDVDGDGVNDLAIGAYGKATAVVLPSSALGAASSASSLWWTIEGATTSTHLGAALASSGDLDGDGVGGLAVAAIDANSGTGEVYVFAADTPAGTLGASEAELTFTPASGKADLGRTLTALGDLNGDGLDDLAIGESDFTTTNADAVYLWLGDGSAGSVSVSDAPIQITRAGSSGSKEPVPFPVGDLDGDGADDLFVTTSDYKDYTATPTTYGSGYAWSGTPAVGVHSISTADVTILGGQSGGAFGTDAAERLDLNDDGALDLAILDEDPAATSATTFGYVRLWYGPLSLSGTWADTDADASITGADSYSTVARYVETAGDVDGDGFTDLWAGKTLVRGGP